MASEEKAKEDGVRDTPELEIEMTDAAPGTGGPKGVLDVIALQFRKVIKGDYNTFEGKLFA
jgi:hypothetical protein